jgi:hypothetical protein
MEFASVLEIDNIRMDYDLGTICFDKQMEIEGAEQDAFSEPGDSGSLIVDENRMAVGLLFGGGGTGGKNGKGLTNANPIRAVVEVVGRLTKQ